jgi:Mrp family chromosome partitioning ATPase
MNALVGGSSVATIRHLDAPRALGTLAAANPQNTPATNTPKALGTLVAANPQNTPATNTPKALSTLTVAERHILGARCRSRLG